MLTHPEAKKMTIHFKFNSQAQVLGKFPAEYSDSVIKNEPMFFNSDLDFAWKNGGEITRNFIDHLPQSWKNSDVVFDSRVHMLMKNWYPCIPGFHHDDVPRRKDQYGQPNYINPEYLSQHLMGLVNGHICPTRFALTVPGHEDDNVFELPDPEKTVYEEWHRAVEEKIQQGHLKSYDSPSGVYLQFDWQTWHEGQQARQSGWRWFGRLSRNTERTQHITNEIRRQVQVYLENPIQGW